MGINISLVIQVKRTNKLFNSSFDHNLRILRYEFHRPRRRSKVLTSLCNKNYIQMHNYQTQIHAQIPRKFSYNGETADNPNLIAIPCLHLIYHLYSKSQHRIPQLIPNTLSSYSSLNLAHFGSWHWELRLRVKT